MSYQVQETNDYSIASKNSMIRTGYFDDDFIHLFSPKYKRRSPLINIGYFVRAEVVSAGLSLFLNSINNDSSCQVLSLGAGFDTTYFRVFSQMDNIIYYEVDHVDVVNEKIQIIKQNSELLSKVKDYQELEEPVALICKSYCLIAQDLNDLTELNKVLSKMGFSHTQPTLIFSECAITYMDENKSRNLIEWASNFSDVMFMIYEQISPEDGFGKVMMNHFMSIETPLRSVEKVQTIEDQRCRFLSAGYQASWSVGAFSLYRGLLTQEQHDRALSLEPFDEWEEWHLTSTHYTLSFGTKGCFNEPTQKFIYRFPSSQTSSDSYIDCPLKWKLNKNIKIECYGHSGVNIWNGTAFLIVGGFGRTKGNRHKRLTELLLVTLHDMKVEEVEVPKIDGLVWDAVHTTATLLSDSADVSTFLLLGGRTSPRRMVNRRPAVVRVSRTEDTVQVTVEPLTEEGPGPRWRHSALYVSGSVLVFGGLTTDGSNLKVLGDCWLLSPDRRWTEVAVVDGPPARFSQSCALSDNTLLMSGGISSSWNVLSDLWLYSVIERRWTEIEVSTTIPRYSHTSHILNKGETPVLVVVGGVNDLSEHQPGIGVVDWHCGKAVDLQLPKCTKEDPIMLHNHCSFLLNGSDKVYILGGGGTCFSFGTSFNKNLIEISLNDVLTSSSLS